MGAEYVLRWLAVGTHRWEQFIRPSELIAWGEVAGLETVSIEGLSYNIFSRHWEQTKDVSVNYFLTMKKPLTDV